MTDQTWIVTVENLCRYKTSARTSHPEVIGQGDQPPVARHHTHVGLTAVIHAGLGHEQGGGQLDRPVLPEDSLDCVHDVALQQWQGRAECTL